MRAKNEIGSELFDPDGAPLLTEAFFQRAEVYDGDKFIRRGAGRPKIAHPKEAVQIRLDHDVLAVLRAQGPGWQTRVNRMLRSALNLDQSA